MKAESGKFRPGPFGVPFCEADGKGWPHQIVVDEGGPRSGFLRVIPRYRRARVVEGRTGRPFPGRRAPRPGEQILRVIAFGRQWTRNFSFKPG